MEQPRRSATHSHVKRGEGSDARRVKKRLENFDMENSRGYRLIRERFSKGVVGQELRLVARILCKHVPELHLDRDATRDHRVLIKWFDENYDVISQHIHKIDMRDANYEIIDRRTDNE